MKVKREQIIWVLGFIFILCLAVLQVALHEQLGLWLSNLFGGGNHWYSPIVDFFFHSN